MMNTSMTSKSTFHFEIKSKNWWKKELTTTMVGSGHQPRHQDVRTPSMLFSPKSIVSLAIKGKGRKGKMCTWSMRQTRGSNLISYMTPIYLIWDELPIISIKQDLHGVYMLYYDTIFISIPIFLWSNVCLPMHLVGQVYYLQLLGKDEPLKKLT